MPALQQGHYKQHIVINSPQINLWKHLLEGGVEIEAACRELAFNIFFI